MQEFSSVHKPGGCIKYYQNNIVTEDRCKVGFILTWTKTLFCPLNDNKLFFLVGEKQWQANVKNKIIYGIIHVRLSDQKAGEEREKWEFRGDFFQFGTMGAIN